MAKQIRNHTAAGAIGSLRDAIKQVGQAERAKVDPDLSTEEKTLIVNKAMDSVDTAMDIIGDSNLQTVLENTDDAIELQHENAEQDEEEQEVGEPPAEPKADQVEEPEA